MSDVEGGGTDWTPIAVLPSVNIQTVKLGGPHIALLGSEDPRYRSLIEHSGDLRVFLSSITGSHGEGLHPGLLAVNREYIGKLPPEAVASFRDIIVASVVLGVRVEAALSVGSRGPFYSNSFDLYPWMIADEKDRVRAISPAIVALHKLQGFRGIACPALPTHTVEDQHVHESLFVALYNRWQMRYIEARDDWDHRAVLRSLNMAAAAMQLPVTSVAETMYDWGRVLSLWVSAFEILVHPGEKERADRDKVLALLSSINWWRQKMTETCHPIAFGKHTEDRTLAEWLYNRLYNLRNDYLHGNPVEASGFRMSNGTSILSCPAALYRMALTSRVPSGDSITREDVRSGRRSIEEYGRFYASTLFQASCEDCLIRAVDPDAEEDID